MKMDNVRGRKRDGNQSKKYLRITEQAVLQNCGEIKNVYHDWKNSEVKLECA
jgi:hypothetical protein